MSHDLSGHRRVSAIVSATSCEFLSATPALASLDIQRSVEFFVVHLGFSRVHVDSGRYGIPMPRCTPRPGERSSSRCSTRTAT